jgi:hypothetical protein
MIFYDENRSFDAGLCDQIMKMLKLSLRFVYFLGFFKMKSLQLGHKQLFYSRFLLQ